MRNVYSDGRKGKVVLVWKFHMSKRKGWGSFEMWTSLKNVQTAKLFYDKSLTKSNGYHKNVCFDFNRLNLALPML